MSRNGVELLLIGGKEVEALHGAEYEVVNPTNGELLAKVAEGGAEDIDLAVESAGKAYIEWAKVKPRDRSKLLRRFADLVEQRAGHIALLETRNTGKPISDSRGEAQLVSEVLHYYAGAIDKLFGETIPTQAHGQLLTFREPVGVVGLITPWNFPMAIAAWKFAPALACGNTVVLKPASLTPLTALELGRMALEAGIPEGVFNVVPGPGATAGNRLAAHPCVDKIAFTGSTEIGADVMRAAAGTIKQVSLELGGKSANLVFADADLEKAAEQSVMSVFGNAGQDCCARSRFIIDESAADEFLERFTRNTASIIIGDPEDPRTQMGPLITAKQRNISLQYIDIGLQEGAGLSYGGTIPSSLKEHGNYLIPAILTGVRNEMRVAQEEIFGPVVSVITFRDEDEAVRIANDSRFGLSGSVWTRDNSRVFRVSRALKTGVVSVNSSHSVHVEAPFGGMKQSGLGRELGMRALDYYTEVKTVYISTN